MVKKNQVIMGIKVEGEHTRTLKYIKGYYKTNKRLPSDKMVFKSIALDHLREDPKYYTKLKRAKL